MGKEYGILRENCLLKNSLSLMFIDPYIYNRVISGKRMKISRCDLPREAERFILHVHLLKELLFHASLV